MSSKTYNSLPLLVNVSIEDFIKNGKVIECSNINIYDNEEALIQKIEQEN